MPNHATRGTVQERGNRREDADTDLPYNLLEDRTLLNGSPFAVGGDPSVNPADFRVTTFASGLNYPKGLMTLADGSIVVSGDNSVPGHTSFYNSTGELLRFTDTNADGIADGAGQVLYNENGLPGQITAIHQAGEFILGTSAQSGQRRDLCPPDGFSTGRPAHAGREPQAHVSHPVGTHDIRLGRPPMPGQPGDFDVIFNVVCFTTGSSSAATGTSCSTPTGTRRSSPRPGPSRPAAWPPARSKAIRSTW